MNYYSNQLERLNLNSEFEPTVIISDNNGNKTNTMNINSESAKVFINFFSQFLPRKIEFKRINSDTNGNPRYVCHFLEFINDEIEQDIKERFKLTLEQNPYKKTDLLYSEALSIAKSLGGRKYNNKSYGGGIVFQSYNIQDLEKKIIELTK